MVFSFLLQTKNMSNTSYKISVKTPCQEDWGGMSNTNDGRFCNSCEKEVIDFTKLSDEEVIDYITKNAKQGGCGRFLNTQLETITINFEENTFDINIAFWKKFVAVFMICFAQQIFNAQVAFTQIPKRDTAITKPNCDTDMMIESPPMSYLDSVLKTIKIDSAVSLKDSSLAGDSTLVRDTTIQIKDSDFTMGSTILKINDYKLPNIFKSNDSIIWYPINKCDILGWFVPIQTKKEIPQISDEPTSILYPKNKKKLNEDSIFENNETVDLKKKNKYPQKEKIYNLPVIAILPETKEKKRKKK